MSRSVLLTLLLSVIQMSKMSTILLTLLLSVTQVSEVSSINNSSYKCIT